MGNASYYIWLIVLIIYIISPLDLFPGFFDDLIAIGLLYYLSYRKTARQKQGTYSHSNNRDNAGSQSRQQDTRLLSLEEAYRTLGVSPDASWVEIKKAYKEKISKCHPDKVSHLNEELQEKAEELTLRLNNTLEVIRKSNGNRSQH
ncbi:MAG: DnaJ domain-containing protein [Nitrospirota bacterium]|nr:DnaJ domain-containing protein [Nitrospirota bacterium]